jgi:hypothetical protein
MEFDLSNTPYVDVVGRMKIVGAVYEIETGCVRFLPSD